MLEAIFAMLRLIFLLRMLLMQSRLALLRVEDWNLTWKVFCEFLLPTAQISCTEDMVVLVTPGDLQSVLQVNHSNKLQVWCWQRRSLESEHDELEVDHVWCVAAT